MSLRYFNTASGRDVRSKLQVIGIMVHVVAVALLARPAVATPVMRDHTMAVAQEEQHLSVPIVRRKPSHG